MYKQYLKKRKSKKEEVKIMCATLDRLAGKTPQELLDEAGIADKMPVNLEKLLKYWNVSVMPTDFSELQKSAKLKPLVAQNGNILGAVALNGDAVGIFYKEGDTPNSQIFTIAHELAHCCLEYEKLQQNSINYRFEKPTDPNEGKMDAFAGELLISENKLKEFISKLIKPSTEKLAIVFGVPEDVMKDRLELLGLEV